MTDITKAYPQLKGWPVKLLGPAPTATMLAQAGAFGRVGKQTLALAMALRDGGVTGAQIVIACGAPQNNHRRDVLNRGMFKRDMTQPNTEAGHTVYKLTLTDKGAKAVAKATTSEGAADTGNGAAVKAVKAKATKKAKARKAKANPADTFAAPRGDNGGLIEPTGDAAPQAAVTDQPTA